MRLKLTCQRVPRYTYILFDQDQFQSLQHRLQTTRPPTMAPKRISLRPTTRNKRAFVIAAWSRVMKARSQPNPARRLKNGLLDVTSKCGEHLEIVKMNSEAPLLRLPAELRNRIWEYTLGGNIFDVVFVETYKGRYVEEKTFVHSRTFKPNTNALLQVCRQIYMETALIPFSHNAFRFQRWEAFEWVRQLLPINQDSIREVHIEAYRAGCVLGRWYENSDDSSMPETFPLEVFPKVKRIVLAIDISLKDDFLTGFGLNAEERAHRVEEFVGKFTDYIKEANPNAELVFEFPSMDPREHGYAAC
ncbi:hypothetical protein C7974DRAFT_157487 [Boeremia exigua]|uniref:uncharacterized protein n=1 Tax=Boeremia exigua TaxID=749465 RepID=UPI001E8CC9B5|nr:uncharacterized protein C7974DRAFT_157487 [Boeremia exigua]KAH6638259.1 hypothetical protein C7974DRAFT_157487 [Boeremia exigua]